MVGKKKIFFDHLPKTAGTSLTKAMEGIVGEKVPLSSVSNRHAMCLNHSTGRNLIAGHVWFDQNEELSKEYYYCTLLRDPVDRFLSQYYFNKSIVTKLICESVLSDPVLGDRQVLASYFLSLEEYLYSDTHDLINTYTNVQAVHFAQRKSNQPFDLSENDLLDAAISSLEDYDLVGTLDQAQGFIDKICDDFNRPHVALLLLNSTKVKKDKNEIAAAVLEKLNESNRVDTKLIVWAKQRFKDARSRVAGLENLNSRTNDTPKFEVSTDAMKIEEKQINTASLNYGSKDIELIQAGCIVHSIGDSVLQSGEELTIRLLCQAHVLEPNLTAGIAVYDGSTNVAYGTNSLLLGNLINISEPGKFELLFKFKANLKVGKYLVTVALHRGVSHHEGCYHWIDNATSFEVISGGSISAETSANFGTKLTYRKMRNDNFYRAFEDRYRGSHEMIKSRMEVYLPFILPLKQFNDVCRGIDLGCGRGEWLQLMQENGVDMLGVDSDQGMLNAAQEQGLKVKHGDAIQNLQLLASESQMLVSAFHLAEHLPFEVLQTLIQESLRVLKPGGLLILETPNPENIVVGTANFYLDPTHQRPIPFQLLSFTVEYAGFAKTKVLRLQEQEGLAENQTLSLMDVLNGVSPDYAVVGQKGGASEVATALAPAFETSYGLSLNKLANNYDLRIQQAEAKAQRAEDFVIAIRNSLPWRLTAPLRWAVRKLRGSRGS